MVTSVSRQSFAATSLLLSSYGQSMGIASSFFDLLQRACCCVSSAFSSVGALTGYIGLPNQYHVRNGTGNKQQRGENNHRPIATTLTALVLFSLCCLLALLSFYFAKTSVDDKGVVKVWRIGLALLALLMAHVAGYLSLPLWGL
ncbi:MAG: hypothetical protein JO028_20950 [Acidobacteriaceae bacterium]|nr:hypothetical protein [Acidobacteriaceae bacterium]